MKIENIEVIILKVKERTNKEGVNYWLIKFADVEDGETFDVIVKDPNKIRNFEVFQKTVISLTLNNSKFGLNLSLM